MDLSTLAKLDAPHLHVAIDGVREANTHLATLRERRLVAVWLRGAKMRTLDGLFDEFAAALQFPYYFGENWDALDECLTDLDWLGDDVAGYTLVVTAASQVLADASPENWTRLLHLLGKAGAEWAEPVSDGEWWDRPGRPFHTVLHETPDLEAALTARLTGVPVSGNSADADPTIHINDD